MKTFLEINKQFYELNIDDGVTFFNDEGSEIPDEDIRVYEIINGMKEDGTPDMARIIQVNGSKAVKTCNETTYEMINGHVNGYDVDCDYQLDN